MLNAFVFLLLVSSFSIVHATMASDLPLRGQGQYKYFFLKIYEAKLWGQKVDELYTAPLKLELKYNRDFKGKDIANQSIKELLSAGLDKNEVDIWRQRLLNIFPDVKEGDKILAVFHPDKGVSFYLNEEKLIGQLPDSNSSKIFLDIWLGKKTSDPSFRNKLLGESL